MVHDASGNIPKLSKVDSERLSTLSFEVGPIRPPSEGGSHSLLLRATRNCPWSRCKFCYGLIYNREKFQLRTVEEIKKDIDAAREIADAIRATSWKLGCGGAVNEDVGTALIRSNPGLDTNQSFILVFNWLYFGAKTVFLQDAIPSSCQVMNSSWS